MMKLLRLIPGVSNYQHGKNRQSPLNAARRHWVTSIQYNSLKKMINLALVLVQFCLKSQIIKGYPPILKMEPTSRCNLKCLGCIAHGTDFPINEGDMPIELFKKICDEMGDYLYKISLYISGEPLLNKEVYEMIAYASKKGVGTVISTNFHAFSEEKADKMIAAGLSHIIIALDGISQQVYGSYRVGGKVDRVLKNLEILSRKKKEAGSSLPFIEIQTVRNEFNEAEIPEIQKMATRLNVDRFTVREDFRGYKPAEKNRTCFWLWVTSLVTETGDVLPCCASSWWNNDNKIFGNVKDSRFREVWNNSNYQKARQVFNRRVKAPETDNHSLCSSCNIFRYER